MSRHGSKEVGRLSWQTRVLGALTEFDSATATSQRMAALRKLQAQCAGNGELKAALRKCLALLIRAERMGVERSVPNADDNLLIRVLLDRLQFTSEVPKREAPPKIEGFTVVSDHWVRPQTDVPTYGRSRTFRSRRNYAQIFWQYQRRCPWLKPWKITLIADDRHGLSAGEVWSVVRHCRCCRILVVELALDFCVPPPVNDAFVRRYGIFGKSRRLG